MILFASLIAASRYAMARVKVRFRGLKAGRFGGGGGNYKSSTDPASRLDGLNSEGVRAERV